MDLYFVPTFPCLSVSQLTMTILSSHTLVLRCVEMWQIFGISKMVRPFSLLVKRHKSGIFYVTGFADSIET